MMCASCNPIAPKSPKMSAFSGSNSPRETLLLLNASGSSPRRRRCSLNQRVIAVRDAELYAKTLQIEHLKAQLAVLRRARYGPSSEKLDREIEQLELTLGELEEGVAESRTRFEQAKKPLAAAPRTKSADHKPRGRKPLPEHLPREEVVHAPPAACSCCGSTVLRRVSNDRTEV